MEDGGYLGFVVPKSLTYIEPWKPTRKFILDNCQIIGIFDLRRAFEDVKLEEKDIKEKSLSNSSLLGGFADITGGVYLQQYPQVLTDKKTTQEDIKIIATYDKGSNLNVDTVINIIPKNGDFKVNNFVY